MGSGVQATAAQDDLVRDPFIVPNCEERAKPSGDIESAYYLPSAQIPVAEAGRGRSRGRVGQSPETVSN